MAFMRPAGAMTGKLLPSGKTSDALLIQTAISTAPVPVRVSVLDAANPFVFVDASTLPDFFHSKGADSPESLAFIELVRRRGAVLMGLAESEEQAALTRSTPKVAVLSPAKGPDDGGRIQVTAFSMGKVHGSLQLTGAVCLASAACTEGTIAHAIRNRKILDDGESGTLKRKDSGNNFGHQLLQSVPLRHSGGDMDVDVRLGWDRNIEDVTVFRTARRLFEGKVHYLM